MRPRTLLDDDSAVSPVIGVILMIAMTVILAAVVGSFVLGMGPDADSVQPAATFSFEYTPGGDSGQYDGTLTVEYESGEQIPAGRLAIRGTGHNASSYGVGPNSSAWASLRRGGAATASATEAGSPAVVSGDAATIRANSTYRAIVVWEASGGERSATLVESDGPDA
jgi:flagellin-like protein